MKIRITITKCTYGGYNLRQMNFDKDGTTVYMKNVGWAATRKGATDLKNQILADWTN